MLNWINPDISHSNQAHNFPSFQIPHVFSLCFKYYVHPPGKRCRQCPGCQRGRNRKRFLIREHHPITPVTRVASPDPGRPTEWGSLRFLHFALDTCACLPEKTVAGDTYCEYGPGIPSFKENWDGAGLKEEASRAQRSQSSPLLGKSTLHPGAVIDCFFKLQILSHYSFVKY